ncbi:glutathione S-transferase alpha-4 isoform X2 [Rattus norvegicus]|uniref:glutathione S-transferase alpha-4 isoform X2 n=1 Tax=Rattus norvegicus TaxID=10116 RepID=UPI002FD80021
MFPSYSLSFSECCQILCFLSWFGLTCSPRFLSNGTLWCVFRIDMYADGTQDLMMMIIGAPFKAPQEKEESLALAVKRAKNRYFPVFEKILKDHGEAFLVGNQLSWADIQLLEAILMVEEVSAPVLSDFPLLQAFKTRISNIPTIKKFLQPGSQRKPPPDGHYVDVVRTVLKF